jgi:hypothetical protein
VTPTATSNFYALTAALHKLKDLISLPPLPYAPAARKTALVRRSRGRRAFSPWLVVMCERERS